MQNSHTERDALLYARRNAGAAAFKSTKNLIQIYPSLSSLLSHIINIRRSRERERENMHESSLERARGYQTKNRICARLRLLYLSCGFAVYAQIRLECRERRTGIYNINVHACVIRATPSDDENVQSVYIMCCTFFD